MTERRTVSSPDKLARVYQAKAELAGTNVLVISPQAAREYLRSGDSGVNAMQQHILARAGTRRGKIKVFVW